MTELTAEAKKIKARLDLWLRGRNVAYNPDAELVARIVNGLARRREKYGQDYCPCRIVSGDPEKDKKIVCPCAFHEEEIGRDGVCHCQLLVARPAGRKD